MSPNYLASSWCAQERNMALRREDKLKTHDNAFIQVVQVRPVNATQVNVMTDYNWIDISGEKIKEGIEKLIATLLRNKQEVNNPKTSLSPELPFTNREDEIDNVLSPTAPPYHIFDAPVGYGKTALLQRVQTRFEEREWLTAFININEQQAKRDIILQLAEAFELDSSKLKGDDPSKKFGSLLLGKWNLDLRNSKKGIVLLFDLKGMPSDNFGYIVNNLLPMTRGILGESKFFSQKHNAFRVIFTGRYLSRSKVLSSAKIEFKIIKLALFNLMNIKKMISYHELFREINETTLSKVAVDLVFVTGGHPGCIAEIVELFATKGGSIRNFIEQNDEYIWSSIVKPFVEDIRAEIPSNLRGKLDTLSVLRRFDIPLLASMTEKYWASDVLVFYQA